MSIFLGVSEVLGTESGSGSCGADYVGSGSHNESVGVGRSEGGSGGVSISEGEGDKGLDEDSVVLDRLGGGEIVTVGVECVIVVEVLGGGDIKGMIDG